MPKSEVAKWEKNRVRTVRIPFTKIEIDFLGWVRWAFTGDFDEQRSNQASPTPSESFTYGKFIRPKPPQAFAPSMTLIEEMILDPVAAEARLVDMQARLESKSRADGRDEKGRFQPSKATVKVKHAEIPRKKGNETAKDRLQSLGRARLDLGECTLCGDDLLAFSIPGYEDRQACRHCRVMFYGNDVASVPCNPDLFDTEIYHGRERVISISTKPKKIKKHKRLPKASKKSIAAFKASVCSNCDHKPMTIVNTGLLSNTTVHGVPGTRKKCGYCEFEVRAMHDPETREFYSVEVMRKGKPGARRIRENEILDERLRAAFRADDNLMQQALKKRDHLSSGYDDAFGQLIQSHQSASSYDDDVEHITSDFWHDSDYG